MLEIKTQKDYDQYFPLVIRVIQSMRIYPGAKAPAPGYEIIIDAGVNGLVKAYEKYDSRGPFMAFAWPVIRNSINRLFRSQYIKRTHSIEEIAAGISRDGNNCEDFIKSLEDKNQEHPAEKIDRLLRKYGANLILSYLSPHERDIVKRYYLEYERDKDIARFYGCSRANIQRKRANAVKKLHANPKVMRIARKIRG